MYNVYRRINNTHIREEAYWPTFSHLSDSELLLRSRPIGRTELA